MVKSMNLAKNRAIFVCARKDRSYRKKEKARSRQQLLAPVSKWKVKKDLVTFTLLFPKRRKKEKVVQGRKKLSDTYEEAFKLKLHQCRNWFAEFSPPTRTRQVALGNCFFSRKSRNRESACDAANDKVSREKLAAAAFSVRT